MATTTNYSWETPDDTDLVKDGAAAIRSLGSAIDSTVFTNAGNAINKTIVDAKGDLIAATAADTVARLAVGTDGQYLKADSSTATGLIWGTVSAGGMTSLATGTLSGASVALTSINQTYNDLKLVISKPSTVTSSGNLQIRINGITTSSYKYNFNDTTTTSFSNNTAQTSFQFGGAIPTSSTSRYFEILIPSYTLATTAKIVYLNQADDSAGNAAIGYGICDTATAVAAITSITILSSGGNFDAGTYTLWGIK